MKKALISLGLVLVANWVCAQQTNEREQRANQIETKAIEKEKPTSDAERSRIHRDSQIESMEKDKPTSESKDKDKDEPNFSLNTLKNNE